MLDTTSLRALLKEAGGLITVSQLGTRWGITREGARLVTKREGFPIPIDHVPAGPSMAPVWVLQDIEAWENEYRPQGETAVS